MSRLRRRVNEPLPHKTKSWVGFKISVKIVMKQTNILLAKVTWSNTLACKLLIDVHNKLLGLLVKFLSMYTINF